ncbi:MAG: iron ABC transporter permease [Methanobacteriota archaeon]|nr:MAG: iron ABC transporter permease [Euryarchaeota archaeon]
MNTQSSLLLWVLPPSLFLLVFFYIPLADVIWLAVSHPGGWIETIGNPLFLRFLYFTFVQAILTTIGSALIGSVSGYLLAHGHPYAEKLIGSALTVPFLLPPLSILVGFVYFFEPAGLLSSLTPLKFDIFGNPWAIVLAHTLYNISVFAKITASGFRNEPADLHFIASVDGASWGRRFRTITIPHIIPMVLAASLITFLYAFNSFAIVLLLGEVRLQTLEVMIYTRTRLRFDFTSGAIIALFQLMVNIIVVLLYLKISSKRKIHTEGGERLVYLVSQKQRIMATGFLLLVIALTWFPILSTFVKFMESYSNASDIQKSQLISGSYDSLLGTSPIRVLLNTVFFAFLTGVIGLLLTIFFILFLQRQRGEMGKNVVSFFTILPMATSGVTVGFSILALFGSSSLFSDLVWVFILASHLMASLPFVVRSMLTAFDYIPQEMLYLSEMLGAGEIRTFRKIVYPQIRGALLVGFLFATAISVGEFGSTFYLSRGEWVTMSTAIGKLFNSRYTMLPLFFASLLSLVSLILFSLIEWIGDLDLKV